MNLSGWMFLIVSWGAITGLFIFAFVRTLRAKEKDLHLPQERSIGQ